MRQLGKLVRTEPFLLSVLAVALGVGAFLGGLATLVIMRSIVHRNLRTQLVKQGVKICIKCGYDLRASKERCPECGEEFGSTIDVRQAP